MAPLRLGILVAFLVLILDQGSKTAVLSWSDNWTQPTYRVTPFLDFVYLWNTGISYGLFPQGDAGRWVLLIIKLAAALLFAAWLARTDRRLEALALGLLIGGAIGNAVDRLVYGAVFDFISFHAFGYHWYVFNIADVAVVVGVVLLLYDALFVRASKTPPSDVSPRG
ncbi:signal peptidase II [Aquabacter spiritensis]|uniref:Lipoprotein signal peptidase n=1 Tax=Aquabacter spiritensis TaxID=933073 RepID=A0A4R3M493_9HYPH|nr:signal peptidase II [Aquabacter spiritensis]TCT06005.1 signal peptidase II [Aquabacter spiritensis]